MKIALKYGLLITFGVAAWTIIAHLLVPNPASAVHVVGASLFFNAVQILGLYLGIREYRKAGAAGFKRWMKMGLAIAVIYGVTASLFFTQVIIFAPHWMQRPPGTENQPLAQVALGAFFGLSAGAIILGLIYSTIISFIFGLIDRPQSK